MSHGQDGHDPGKGPSDPWRMNVPVVPSLGPQPKSDMDAGVSGILNKLNQTTMNVQAKWTMVAQHGCMSVWAATKEGGDVTLKPVILGLRKFLKELYAGECTGASDSMVCKEVEVCFWWRSAHESDLGTCTPPCMEENSSDENSDKKSDEKSGEKSDEKSDEKPDEKSGEKSDKKSDKKSEVEK